MAANLSTVPVRTQPRGRRRGREKGTELAARVGVQMRVWATLAGATRGSGPELQGAERRCVLHPSRPGSSGRASDSRRAGPRRQEREQRGGGRAEGGTGGTGPPRACEAAGLGWNPKRHRKARLEDSVQA